MTKTKNIAFCFDMMDTLVMATRPPDDMAVLAAELNVDERDLQTCAERLRTYVERGEISPHDWLRNILRMLGISGYSSQQIEELIDLVQYHYTAAFQPIDGAFETIELLRSWGKVAIGSNVSFKGYDVARNFQLDELVDEAYFSCLYGLVKPNLDFYRSLARRLDLPPNRCFFYDDSPESVIAANQTGMHGVVVLHPSGIAARRPESYRNLAWIHSIREAGQLASFFTPV